MTNGIRGRLLALERALDPDPHPNDGLAGAIRASREEAHAPMTPDEAQERGRRMREAMIEGGWGGGRRWGLRQ
jgi:hypothetical protein